MDLADFIYSNLSYIFFPISIYFLYILYKRTYEEKENNLFLILVTYSILYVEYKYGVYLNNNIPLFLMNIPLLIAIMKKKTIHIIIISLILVFYFYGFYENWLLIIFLEYILYILFYLKNKNIYYTLIFITITQILMQSIYIGESELIYYMYIILSGIIFYIFGVFVIFIFQKYEELLKVFLSVKELKQNNQIKNSLFKISHEIKNPIAVCKGYLDMFDIKNENHVKKYIPILKEEIDRSLLILEDFLSMNKLKLNKDILDINMLIEEASFSYRHLFRKNNIDLVVNLIDDEIYINGDYNKLLQVVINIFKNTFEALDKSKKMKFEITEELYDSYIIIKFLDNGIGISKENLKKIKEPFFTTKIGGTGLGTSLSTEIIEAHNGEINYESEEGKYTRVTIKLPIINF